MSLSPATIAYDTPYEVVIPVSEWKNPFAVRQVSVPSIDDTATGEYGEFAPHYAKLRKISSDPAMWVNDIAPSPNTLTWAYLVLRQLEVMGFLPAKIVASAEGGTAVCFVDGSKYADIESLNTGAILGVLSDRHGMPIVWDIEPSEGGIALAIDRIRKFIHAP